jgi:hypothetical protein
LVAPGFGAVADIEPATTVRGHLEDRARSLTSIVDSDSFAALAQTGAKPADVVTSFNAVLEAAGQ